MIKGGIMLKKAVISVFLFIFLISAIPRAFSDSEINLNNSVNTITAEERENITLLLSSCADIMRFDRSNFDFDTLMTYLLCTHENFSSLTQSVPYTTSGPDGISIVNGDYIDNILTTVFQLSPEHPSVDALVDRGFCCSNGMYYYRNVFTADFHTQFQALETVYNLGGGVYYVVFSDTYYENNTAFPEKSFAVIQKNSSLPYSLIRLGMGERLLSNNEIIAYTPQKTYQNPRWQTAPPDYTPNHGLSLGILIAIIAASVIIFIIGSIALIRELFRR